MVICGGTIFRSLHETLTYDLVSRIIMCGAYCLYYLRYTGISNLVSGFLLSYHFGHLTLTLTSDLISSFLYLEHISFITNMKMCIGDAGPEQSLVLFKLEATIPI